MGSYQRQKLNIIHKDKQEEDTKEDHELLKRDGYDAQRWFWIE